MIYSASLSAKGKSTSGKVNMEELIGNTDGFADSGSVREIASMCLDLTYVIESVRPLFNDI